MSERCGCVELPCPKCGADLDKWIELNAAETNASQLERFRAALTSIARLDEGAVVNSSFDEPGSADCAREALAAEWVGPCVHGRDPWDRCDVCCDDGEVVAWARAQRGEHPEASP